MKNRRRSQNVLQRPMVRWSWFFLLPMVSAFAIGFVWPFLQGIYLSFCEFRLISDAKWVGLKNYISVFQDTNFMRSFGYTAVFAVVSLAIINVLAFMVAYVLTLEIKGSNIFRTVFFMPNLIGGVVLGYIWQILINGVLSVVGEPLLALNTTAGYWGLIILMCWQQVGYMMIIYIAGIQNIPGELIEAAKIDGANNRQLLRHVTLPLVMPSITICSFLTLTNSFKLYDQNLALTAGEPSNKSEMLALNIYNTFYGRTGWEGVGQAKAVIFFLAVAVIAMVQLKLSRSKEVQA